MAPPRAPDCRRTAAAIEKTLRGDWRNMPGQSCLGRRLQATAVARISRRAVLAGAVALGGSRASAAVLRRTDSVRFGLTPVFLTSDLEWLGSLQAYLSLALDRDWRPFQYDRYVKAARRRSSCSTARDFIAGTRPCRHPRRCPRHPGHVPGRSCRVPLEPSRSRRPGAARGT